MKKQKQQTVLYFIDHDGIKFKYEPKFLVYPERTKLWSRLNYWLNTDQVQQIGYEPHKQ